MIRPLPVLVPCDRLHARLSHTSCVARYTARVVSTSMGERPSSEGRVRHPECEGCPQGAARAGRPARRAPTAPSADVPNTRAEAVAAIVDGRCTVAQVAEAHDVTVTAVRYWLRLAGVKRHSERGTPVHPRRAEADARLAQGETCGAIAEHMGLHINTVRRWAAEGRAAAGDGL